MGGHRWFITGYDDGGGGPLIADYPEQSVGGTNLRMMYFLRGCLTWMMTEMMSRMKTRPQVTPMMVMLVLSRVSRIEAFLFSGGVNGVQLAAAMLDNDGGEECTFAVVLVPGVHAVLDAVADQRVVDAHVAVAEECVSFTRS